jgi:hypothetical protein
VQLDYFDEAVSLLKRCRAQGEDQITVDFDDKIYYFGRTSDGYGTTYPIDNVLALDELAGALERHFQFVHRR